MNSKFIENLKYDLPASVVVFFVAVPLCLGIALASGAPLFSGLISGIIGGVVVGAISNSSIGVSGPAAGLAVIVFNAIISLGNFEAFLLSVVIAGVFQLVFGILKAGIIGYYFPSSVIKGMLTGIGIIIILKQIPHTFGYDKDYEGDESFQQIDGENTFSELITMIDYITPGAVVISLVSLAILILWDVYLSKKHKVFTLVQGPLVAVATGILLQLVFAAYIPDLIIRKNHLVDVPVANSINDFFQNFSFPDFSQITNPHVYVTAITIAVVASLETLLSVEATDKLNPTKSTTSTNRELFAQGVGNIIAGLVGGLPVTQVIVRSSANIQSGGKSKVSAIIHGVLILICIVSIPAILNMIPLSVLACILLVVGFKLAKPSLFKQMYRLGWNQFIPFIVTMVGIVFTDLLQGIAFGVCVGIFIILKDSLSNSHFLSKTDLDNHIVITLAEHVTFLNKGAILKELNSIPHNSNVIIDMSGSFKVDYDVIEIIENFKLTALSRNINLTIKSDIEYEIADY